MIYNQIVNRAFTDYLLDFTQIDFKITNIHSIHQLSLIHIFSLSGVKAIDQIADAIKQPSLKEMKVKDMTLDFTIKDGRVETQPFDIKMGDYNLNLSGSTGLDQTIDYTGKIKLPASAGNISKMMTLDLKIGGSFTSPKVSVDTKSMACLLYTSSVM